MFIKFRFIQGDRYIDKQADRNGRGVSEREECTSGKCELKGERRE